VDRTDWDARYASRELVWGSEPNRFLAATLGALAPSGRALDLGCGEGRNAIWLAGRGWRVTGVDYSSVAIERARRLAEQAGVAVEWHCVDLARFAADPAAFGLVAIAYLQLPAAERRRVLGMAAAALEPGGVLYMIGHARDPRNEAVPGPKDPSVCWDPSELAAELCELGLVVERCANVQRQVEMPEGERTAVDTEAIARRPCAERR